MFSMFYLMSELRSCTLFLVYKDLCHSPYTNHAVIIILLCVILWLAIALWVYTFLWVHSPWKTLNIKDNSLIACTDVVLALSEVQVYNCFLVERVIVSLYISRSDRGSMHACTSYQRSHFYSTVL